jgi:hypothetical protein
MEDRFVAQHTAFFYYWMVVCFVSIESYTPQSQRSRLEQEAYGTYNFLETYAEYLKAGPAKKSPWLTIRAMTCICFDTMHFGDGSRVCE